MTTDTWFRAFRAGRAVAGMLCTGSDKKENGYGNGDCLLVDTRRRVFAVADATERSPRASRILLERLHALIRQAHRLSPASLHACVQQGYARQDYEQRSALVVVALTGDRRRLQAVIISGGDCSASIYQPGHRPEIFRTPVNMAFAGRSLDIPDPIVTDIDGEPARIVLASDGVTDMPRAAVEPRTATGILESGLLYRGSESDLPALIQPFRAAGTVAYDDQALLVIDPHGTVTSHLPPFTLGGTTGAEENRYHRNNREAAPSEWLPAAAWDNRASQLVDAGCHRLSDNEETPHDH